MADKRGPSADPTGFTPERKRVPLRYSPSTDLTNVFDAILNFDDPLSSTNVKESRFDAFLEVTKTISPIHKLPQEGLPSKNYRFLSSPTLKEETFGQELGDLGQESGSFIQEPESFGQESGDLSLLIGADPGVWKSAVYDDTGTPQSLSSPPLFPPSSTEKSFNSIRSKSKTPEPSDPFLFGSPTNLRKQGSQSVPKRRSNKANKQSDKKIGGNVFIADPVLPTFGKNIADAFQEETENTIKESGKYIPIGEETVESLSELDPKHTLEETKSILSQIGSYLKSESPQTEPAHGTVRVQKRGHGDLNVSIENEGQRFDFDILRTPEKKTSKKKTPSPPKF